MYCTLKRSTNIKWIWLNSSSNKVPVKTFPLSFNLDVTKTDSIISHWFLVVFGYVKKKFVLFSVKMIPHCFSNVEAWGGQSMTDRYKDWHENEGKSSQHKIYKIEGRLKTFAQYCSYNPPINKHSVSVIHAYCPLFFIPTWSFTDTAFRAEDTDAKIISFNFFLTQRAFLSAPNWCCVGGNCNVQLMACISLSHFKSPHQNERVSETITETREQSIWLWAQTASSKGFCSGLNFGLLNKE